MSDAATGARTALVVDDETDLLDVLDEALREAGFVTTCFTTGRPAIEALKQRPYDLLLTDVGLPDINGLRICMAARELYDEDVVVLVMTGADRRARQIGAFTLGADDFISKPFDIEELLARVQAKLARAAGTR